VSDWALLPWHRDSGAQLLHDADVSTAVKLLPYGKVFCVTGRDGAFVVLNYGTVSLRAVPTAIVPIAADVRAIGESVRLKNGEHAEVREVLWHHLRAEPMYLLRVAGKKKSKRSWNSDFTS
jgi:hypothetical protein